MSRNKIELSISLRSDIVQGGFALRLKKVINEGLDATARFVAGQTKQRAGRASIVGTHFNRNNASKYGFPPLKPATIRAKQRKYGNQPILVASGAMRDAMLGKVVVRRLRDGQVQISFTVPDYAIHHHTGTPKMPRRDPVSIVPEDQAAAAEYMDQFVQLSFAAIAVQPKVEV